MDRGHGKEVTAFAVLAAISVSHLPNDTIQSLIPAITMACTAGVHACRTAFGAASVSNARAMAGKYDSACSLTTDGARPSATSSASSTFASINQRRARPRICISRLAECSQKHRHLRLIAGYCLRQQ
jgi:hypothetical protein